MTQDMRPAQGFTVIESSDAAITLERTNSWLAVIAGVVLGAF